MAGVMVQKNYDFTAVSDGNTLYYKITDASSTPKTVEVVAPGENELGGASWDGYTAPTGTLTIPETVTYDGTTYSVTSIGDRAFYECSGFTGSLTIGNSVTSIGEKAFAGDWDKPKGFTGSLTIPNSVTSIGNYAFNYCSGFTGSLTIGNSVTSIGESAFDVCYGFTGSLIIPNSVTSIGKWAFTWCKGFTGSLTIGNSVTSIGRTAFFNCDGFTGSLIIPNSVTSIAQAAFAACSGFTNLTMLRAIPPTVKGSEIFDDVTFTEVSVPAGAKDIYDGDDEDGDGKDGDGKWQGLTIVESHK